MCSKTVIFPLPVTYCTPFRSVASQVRGVDPPSKGNGRCRNRAFTRSLTRCAGGTRRRPGWRWVVEGSTGSTGQHVDVFFFFRWVEGLLITSVEVFLWCFTVSGTFLWRSMKKNLERFIVDMYLRGQDLDVENHCQPMQWVALRLFRRERK